MKRYIFVMGFLLRLVITINAMAGRLASWRCVRSVVGERERGWCFHIGQCTVRTGVALESSLAMFS